MVYTRLATALGCMVMLYTHAARCSEEQLLTAGRWTAATDAGSFEVYADAQGGRLAFILPAGSHHFILRASKDSAAYSARHTRATRYIVRRGMAGDARPKSGLWIGRPGIWAIAAPQQRGRRPVTDQILVERLERGLPSVAKVRNRRLSGESRISDPIHLSGPFIRPASSECEPRTSDYRNSVICIA